MDVIAALATSLDRRDEIPNQELAKKIVKAKDKKAISVLVDHLKDKNKNIQADCIKVLYEIGEEQPELIDPYIREFTDLLSSKNNRMVWGAMHALDTITDSKPAAIYKLLPVLIDVSNRGSVITRDHLVRMLVKLEARPKYKGEIFPLLVELMTNCPTNQFPMYAETALPVVDKNNQLAFLSLLKLRLAEMDSDARKNRVLKIIKKLSGR